MRDLGRSTCPSTAELGCGIPAMELGGLEPPTSWVRSRRSLALTFACFAGFSSPRWPGARGRFSASFRPFRLDRAKEAGFWPDLPSNRAYVHRRLGVTSGHLRFALLGVAGCHSPPFTVNAPQ